MIVPSLGASTTTTTSRYDKFGCVEPDGFTPWQRLRLFVIGIHKVGGKTTLFAQRRNNAYLDFEGGSQAVPMGPGSTRFRIRSFKQLMDLMNAIHADTQKGECPFEHITFDTVDVLISLVAEHLSAFVEWCAKNHRSIYEFGEGKGGHNLIAQSVLLYPRAIAEWNLGWTVLGQMKLRETRALDGSVYEEWTSAAPGLVDSGLKCLADMNAKVLSITEQGVETQGKKVVPVFTRRFWFEPQTPPEEAAQGWTSAHRGSRVTMPERLEIPKIRGIDAIEAAYEGACHEEAKVWKRSS